MIEFLIRKLERYQPLSSDERESLRTLPIKSKFFSRGEVIAGQGSCPDESALLLEGFAFRYKVLQSGSRQIVSVQIPGDFVDLHSLLLRPLDHAVAAASPAQIGRVSHASLKQLIEKHPRLGLSLMWDVAVDGAVSREWLATQGRRSAYQQLAHLFCELYLRLDWAGLVEERSINLPLTQAELGDCCGLSTVHVNRSLQSLRRDGLVKSEGQRLSIPDLDALARAAEFDPDYLHLLG